MRMLGLAIGLVIAIVLLAALVVHFSVPETRSGTHTITLDGTVEEVWDVYTDPGSLPEWRASVIEIVDLEGEPGQRAWTKVSEHGVRINFRETAFDVPTRYELATASEGYFEGSYFAEFEQVGPKAVRGTFTETLTTNGFRSKLLALLFVRPKQLIEDFAHDAQREINRRSSETQ